jgi:hypothetical protein
MRVARRPCGQRYPGLIELGHSRPITTWRTAPWCSLHQVEELGLELLAASSHPHGPAGVSERRWGNGNTDTALVSVRRPGGGPLAFIVNGEMVSGSDPRTTIDGQAINPGWDTEGRTARYRPPSWCSPT